MSEKLAINCGEKAVVALPPPRFHFDNAITTGNAPGYNDSEEEAFCKEFAEFMGAKYAEKMDITEKISKI